MPRPRGCGVVFTAATTASSRRHGEGRADQEVGSVQTTPPSNPAGLQPRSAQGQEEELSVCVCVRARAHVAVEAMYILVSWKLRVCVCVFLPVWEAGLDSSYRL